MCDYFFGILCHAFTHLHYLDEVMHMGISLDMLFLMCPWGIAFELDKMKVV